jgi:hypothetical protein
VESEGVAAWLYLFGFSLLDGLRGADRLSFSCAVYISSVGSCKGTVEAAGRVGGDKVFDKDSILL